MRDLKVSFGGEHPARIVRTAALSWPAFVAVLQEVKEADDKAAVGWYAASAFSPSYRHGENFVARHALTFDYDHVDEAGLAAIRKAYANVGHFAYTTFSHTAEKPRWRYVFPLSRPAACDEFQAVSRMVASWAGIDLAARESHVPAQFMYLPARRPGAPYKSHGSPGPWVDVDGVLASYKDWTDRSTWPHREGDAVHADGESVDPTTKQGIVGDFCRAYTIEEAIEAFDLPYEKVR